VLKPVLQLSRDRFRKLAYRRIEILNGFCVLAPRFGGRHAILTYNRDAKKVFRYFISIDNLRELFMLLDNFCRNSPEEIYEEYFVIGRLEFHLEKVQDIVVINLGFSTHKFVIMGLISQLNAAIAQYHAPSHGVADGFEKKIRHLLKRGASLIDED